MAPAKSGTRAQSYWVSPGRLAAGEYPGHQNPRQAAAKVRRLLDAGIDHFIDLTHRSDGLAPYADIAKAEAEKLDVEVEIAHFPIVDVSVPDRPEQMAVILDAIDSALWQGKTVYVHCWGGVGRTGTVVGCWLRRHGETGDKALGLIARWWGRVPKSWRLPRSPETREQRDYVRRWSEPAPRRERP